MDYEKAYTNAVERAKQAIKDCDDNKGRKKMIEDIFPELASEDEKIRKAIKSIIAFSPTAMFDKVSVSREDALAWIEKQGERNVQERVYQVGNPRRRLRHSKQLWRDRPRN